MQKFPIAFFPIRPWVYSVTQLDHNRPAWLNERFVSAIEEAWLSRATTVGLVKPMA